MSTAANLHGRPIHDGSVPEVLYVGLDLSIGSADDGDGWINLGRGFGRGRHAPNGPLTPSLPRRERARQCRLSVPDGVCLAARIGPALQHTALRMSNDHAVQASPLEPIRQPIDVMPTLP